MPSSSFIRQIQNRPNCGHHTIAAKQLQTAFKQKAWRSVSGTPCFFWRARRESNPQPTASEAATLSIEPRAHVISRLDSSISPGEHSIVNCRLRRHAYRISTCLLRETTCADIMIILQSLYHINAPAAKEIIDVPKNNP